MICSPAETSDLAVEAVDRGERLWKPRHGRRIRALRPCASANGAIVLEVREELADDRSKICVGQDRKRRLRDGCAIDEDQTLNSLRLEFGKCCRHLAAEGMSDDRASIYAKLVENRRHECRLALDCIAGAGRRRAAVADQINTNDPMIDRKLWSDLVPPIDRSCKSMNEDDWGSRAFGLHVRRTTAVSTIRPPSRGAAARVLESTQKVLSASATMLNARTAIIVILMDWFLAMRQPEALRAASGIEGISYLRTKTMSFTRVGSIAT